MDESLYREFDDRARSFITHFASVTNQKLPKRKERKELKKLFIAEVRRALRLPYWDIQALHHSIYIAHHAYEGILRRDGEPYILHVFRGALVLVWGFERFHVMETHLVTRLLHLMLQHDSLEETAEMRYRGMLVRTLIRIRFEKRVTTGVSHLTQGEDESDKEYLERMLVHAAWEDLLVKVVERTDNIFKLEKDNPEKSKKKIADTLETFRRLTARLNELVLADIRAGRISPVWMKLVSFLTDYLWFAVNSAKARPEFATP